MTQICLSKALAVNRPTCEAISWRKEAERRNRNEGVQKATEQPITVSTKSSTIEEGIVPIYLTPTNQHWACDIEADNLLDKATRIWCVCVENVLTGEKHAFTDREAFNKVVGQRYHSCRA
jgi:hypothetical protein